MGEAGTGLLLVGGGAGVGGVDAGVGEVEDVGLGLRVDGVGVGVVMGTKSQRSKEALYGYLWQ